MFYAFIITFALALIIILLLIKKIKADENDFEYTISRFKKENEKRIQSIEENYTSEKNLYETRINTLVFSLHEEKEITEQLRQKISNTKCIACGETSNGKHFCFSCYTKFKKRSIDVRINDCKIEQILDYYGNKTILCDCGICVRSRAEALICNYLFSNKIRFIYEKPVYFTDENDICKQLHPDFYLPDYNIYIEYNEIGNADYSKQKTFAMNVYKQKGLKVIIMTSEDISNVGDFLSRQLNL